MFQQKNNIDNNRIKYIQYSNLAGEIKNYCATGEIVVGDPKLAFLNSLPKVDNSVNSNSQAKEKVSIVRFTVKPVPNEFINYINYQMEKYNDIAIIVDDTKTTIDGSRVKLP